MKVTIEYQGEQRKPGSVVKDILIEHFPNVKFGVRYLHYQRGRDLVNVAWRGNPNDKELKTFLKSAFPEAIDIYTECKDCEDHFSATLQHATHCSHR